MRRLALGLYVTASAVRSRAGTRAAGNDGTRRKSHRRAGRRAARREHRHHERRYRCVREIISRAEGSYFASQLVPGRYRIAAKLEGFKALDRRGITLTVGQTTTLDLTLEVGGLAETLTVTGEAALVDVTSAEIGGHISAEELNDLPSANRNYMAFVGNVPGTVFIPSGEFLNDSFQANGQPTAANNIVFDGANNTDDQRGSNVGGQTRAANESIAGSADSHEPVRRGVGTRIRRGHQRRDEVGHQPVLRVGVQFLHEQGDDQQGLLHQGRRGSTSRTSARRNGAAPSADRSSATSCTSSSASSGSAQPELHATASARGPSYNFVGRQRRVGVELPVAHRPSDQFEALLGVPLAAGDGRRSSTGSTASRKRLTATTTRPTSTRRWSAR